MGARERPFYERLRRFQDVLEEISADFGGTHRLTPILDVDPPRVVSIAIQPANAAPTTATPTVYVTASDRSDVASPKGKAALRRRIDTAVRELGSTQLSLDANVRSRPRNDS